MKDENVIRKLLVCVGALYLGKKVFDAFAPQSISIEHLPQDEPLNPVVTPELADRLRALTVEVG